MEGSEECPVLSIIMGCYNNENTIAESIQSILNQTISDFEFIIIDDCSNDRTIEIINSFNDKRIRLIRNEINKGLGYSLYLGVNLAKGKYIARMDADDISYPIRFQKQIYYMEHHPNVICLGTGAKKIGAVGWFIKLFSPNIIPICKHEEVKTWLLIGTPILHPSVMLNAILLKKYGLNYNPQFKRAQDYELWSRMIWKGDINNIKDILMCYRYSPTQASSVYKEEQSINSKIIYNRMLSRLIGRPLTEDEVQSHYLFARKCKLSKDELLKVKIWLDFLYPYIMQSSEFDKKLVINLFSYRWSVVCRNSCNYYSRIIEYLQSKYYNKYKYLIYLLRP